MISRSRSPSTGMFTAEVKFARAGSLIEGFLNHLLHRYMVSMAVSDYSGQAWFQGFNDVGQTVFGMTADELVEIKVRSGFSGIY